MATHENLTSLFTDIADAIREKTGSGDTLVADEFPSLITNIGASTLPSTGTSLEDCTWEEVDLVSAEGLGASYWSVGDTKSVTVSGTVGSASISGTYWVYILGFDHNGATNTIDFGTFKTAQTSGTDICLINSYASYATDGTKYFNMNHWGNYNYGGWKGCDLRYDILGSTNTAPSGYGSAVTSGRTGYDAGTTTATSPVSGTLMAALSSDLRAVMKPMTIYTDNTGGGSNTASHVTSSVDYLPLLAECEIFGSSYGYSGSGYANDAEKNYQAQYTYFANGNSKVKYRHSATTSTAYWWERSPYCITSGRFCFVITTGNASNHTAAYSYGLAPAFRI